MTLEFAGKVLAQLLPVGWQILAYLGVLHKRYRDARAIVRAVGDLGWEFWVVCIASTRIQRFLVQLIAVLAGLMLITGLTLAFAPSDWVKIARPKGFWALEWLFGFAWAFPILYLLLALTDLLDLWRKIPLWIIEGAARVWPSAGFRPGLVAARELVEEGDDHAQIVAVNAETCDVIAGEIIGRLLNNDPLLADDHANSTPGLTPAEQANSLLIGCVAEACIHRLDSSHPVRKGVKFGHFYRKLGGVGLHASRPFDPENLKASRATGKSLVVLINVLAQEPLVPDEASVRTALNDSMGTLSREYGADASRLAVRLWRMHSASVALRRSRGFTHFNADFGSMATQFVKLAVSAGVWHGIRPGPFVFPFSSTVVAYLLHRGCLRVSAETSEVNLGKGLARVSAYAVKTIVERFDSLVLRDDAEKRTRIEQLLGLDGKVGLQREWALCREADYFVWCIARSEAGSTSWKRVGDSLRKD